MPSADHEGSAARASLRPTLRRLQERGPVAALGDRDATSAVPSSEHRGAGRRRLASTVITAVAVLAIDQVTKSIALARLHRPVHLFGPFGFNLTFNSGTGFSLFTGPVGVIVVVVVAVIVLIGVVAWRSTTTRLSIVLGLIVGGALGNLSDRLFRGHHV